ncbi:MAG: YebC/PmpR family DNA-binding transcriptional regulator [Patescibacteria group bacterium]
MSGHSKWATIHRQKEVKDAKRGAAFTKLAMAITVAVRAGGGVGDADKNFRLRLAMDKARAANMPKENIQRAIDKGTGAGGGVILTEAMYEGFLPGGAAIMVETLSDNKLRTAQEVRLALEKGGGTFASTGSVGYMFSHVGELRVKSQVSNLKSQEEQELDFIDAGAADIIKDDSGWDVYCDKDQTFEIKEKLDESGYIVESAELIYKPTTYNEVSDETTLEKIGKIVEAIEDLDDVAHVWTNLA